MPTPTFVFAPDTKIKNHPIKFGETIPATNKKFKLSMATIGHWKDGKMIEEYLFWDNQSFMKQIGLSQ